MLEVLKVLFLKMKLHFSFLGLLFGLYCCCNSIKTILFHLYYDFDRITGAYAWNFRIWLFDDQKTTPLTLTNPGVPWRCLIQKIIDINIFSLSWGKYNTGSITKQTFLTLKYYRSFCHVGSSYVISLTRITQVSVTLESIGVESVAFW